MWQINKQIDVNQLLNSHENLQWSLLCVVLFLFFFLYFFVIYILFSKFLLSITCLVSIRVSTVFMLLLVNCLADDQSDRKAH